MQVLVILQLSFCSPYLCIIFNWVLLELPFPLLCLSMLFLPNFLPLLLLDLFNNSHGRSLCFRYIVTFLMIWHLNKRAVLLPPKMGTLQFGDYIKSGERSLVFCFVFILFNFCMWICLFGKNEA